MRRPSTHFSGPDGRTHLSVAGSTTHPRADQRVKRLHNPLFERFLARLYRGVVRRAARQALQGRRLDPRRVEAGRFLRTDVDAFLADTWRRVGEVLTDGIAPVPTLGSRHNAFLGVLTVAAYHALLARGLDRAYAAELFADVGWKVYERALGVPLLFARLTTRSPQARVNRTLRGLMRFPFNAPGRPGYEVEVRVDDAGMHTHWSYCAPLGFVHRYVARHGDRGEVEAFKRSWCSYDWAAADLLAGAGPFERGHYERPHTLSEGDEVCDMRWTA